MAGFIIDHAVCGGPIRSLDKIPSYWLQKAKTDLHIAYGTASHGLQVHYGAVCLNTWDGSGTYAFNNGGTGGALDWRTWTSYGYFGNLGIALSLDLDAATNQNRTVWDTATRTYLDANPDVNVVMWAWCAGLISGSESQIANDYLARMAALELDYPSVKFVYMTGHTNGDGLAGNTHLRNEQIRTYCNDNDKVLYDFEDIESYDPDGTYFGALNVDEDCSYTGGNWALEWQAAHTVGTDWFECHSSCLSCHSQDLNCNQKAVAVWHLFARLAGWDGMSQSVYELPGDRRPLTWRPGIYTSGVYTGIPTRTTYIDLTGQSSYGGYTLDNTGVVDSSSAINTALIECPVGYAVKLGSGTFRHDSPIVLRSGVVLRGSGAGVTTLKPNGSIVGITATGASSLSTAPISSGYTKGSVTLTFASLPTGLVAGDYAMIYQTNNASVHGGSSTYMTNTVAQIVRVESIDGLTVTLDRELYFTYTAANTPTLARMYMMTGVGVETLTLDGENALSRGIQYQSCADSWINKVEVKNVASHFLRIIGCARCEFTKNYIHGGRYFSADTAYGCHLYGRNTDNYIYDNMFYFLRHSVTLEYGGCGNVIAYNYGWYNWDENYPTPPSIMQAFHTHGGFPHMNLLEGNICPQINFDSYLGIPSSYANTVFRNWSKGYDHSGLQYRRYCVEDAVWNRSENIVGNVLGRSGDYGIGDYEQVAGDVYDEAVYRLGWSGNSYSGTMYGVTLPDALVISTIIRHGNYDYMTAQTRYESGEETALPDSLYLSSKPTWFGELDWPPIDPVSPATNDTPVKWRWDNYVAGGSSDVALLFADTEPGTGGDVKVAGTAVAESSSAGSITITKLAAASDYLEDVVLDHVFKVAAYTVPTNIYVALCKSTVDDTHTGSTLPGEVSGGGYVRTLCNTWSVAADGFVSNENRLIFPSATADWGTITDIAICDSQTVGEVLVYGKLFNYKTVEIGDIMEFEAGGLLVTLD